MEPRLAAEGVATPDTQPAAWGPNQENAGAGVVVDKVLPCSRPYGALRYAGPGAGVPCPLGGGNTEWRADAVSLVRRVRIRTCLRSVPCMWHQLLRLLPPPGSTVCLPLGSASGFRRRRACGSGDISVSG